MRKTLQQRINEGQNISKAIHNTNRSYYNRQTRLNNRIKAILNQEHSYFITFTISPEKEHIKYNTIVRKIKEALGGASLFVFNADYGKLGGRLHFHSLASFDYQLDYTTLNNIYKYGAINFKPIIVKNETALKEYIQKQQLHIEKQTASKIYFSRNKDVDNIKLLHNLHYFKKKK